MVLVATAFLCLGLINLDFKRHWLAGQAFRLAVGAPLVAIFVYVTMPPLVFPQVIPLLLLTFVPNALYSGVLSLRSWIVSRRVVSMHREPLLPYAAGTLALFVLFAVFEALPFLDASGLRNLAHAVTSTAAPQRIDPRLLRVVPQESAVFEGEKVIGQLGAYYRVGNYHVQPVAGQLVWVAPLEFRDVIKWLTRRTSPGVVVVSAQSPDQGAELLQDEPMKYIPSAFLNDNLARHVYFRYGNRVLLETTLQLDDHRKAWYVCTLGRPTIGNSGMVVTDAVIVDPVTGAMTRYRRARFDQLPHWVRRVVPPSLALDYNIWFGLYVHGWWNAHTTERDVHLPARDEVFGILSSGDQFVWFVDHTSPAASDASMTGFTYMNAVTGAMTYYTAVGGSFSSKAAENAVASNGLVRQSRLQATQPVLYDLFGEITWVVPVVADTGKFQTLALVQARNGHVVVGNPQSPFPVQDALAQYQAWVGGLSPRGVAEGTETGVLDRVARTSSQLIFTLRGSEQIYAINDPQRPDELLARSGDHVRFQSTPGGAEGERIVVAFTNESLSRPSPSSPAPSRTPTPR